MSSTYTQNETDFNDWPEPDYTEQLGAEPSDDQTGTDPYADSQIEEMVEQTEMRSASNYDYENRSRSGSRKSGRASRSDQPKRRRDLRSAAMIPAFVIAIIAIFIALAISLSTPKPRINITPHVPAADSPDSDTLPSLKRIPSLSESKPRSKS